MTVNHVPTHASGSANVSGQRKLPRGRVGEYLGSRSHESALEGLHAGLRADVELLACVLARPALVEQAADGLEGAGGPGSLMAALLPTCTRAAVGASASAGT